MKRQFLGLLIPFFAVQALPAWAENVTVSGDTVYVTADDCRVLSRHRPDQGVTYRPGVDVKGKYVAPADLNGGAASALPPGKVGFDVLVNPMENNPGQGRYKDTTLPVARVEVDLATGETFLNGRSLTPEQDKIVWDACKRSGYR